VRSARFVRDEGPDFLSNIERNPDIWLDPTQTSNRCAL